MGGFDVKAFKEAFIKRVENMVNGENSDKNDGVIQDHEQSIFRTELDKAIKSGEISEADAKAIFGLELSGTTSAGKPRKAEGTGNNGDGDGSGSTIINDPSGGSYTIINNGNGSSTIVIQNINNVVVNITVDAHMEEMVNKIIEAIQNNKFDSDDFKDFIQNNVIGVIKGMFQEFKKNEDLKFEQLTQFLATMFSSLEMTIDNQTEVITALLERSFQQIFRKYGEDMEDLFNCLKNMTKNQETNNKLLMDLYDAVKNLTSDFSNYTNEQKNQFKLILDQLNAGNLSLSQIQTLLAQIKNDTSENCDNSKKIIELIAEGKTEILEALAEINANFADFDADIKDLLVKIYAKIGKGGGGEGGGGSTDLTEVLEVLNEMLKTLKNIDKSTSNIDKSTSETNQKIKEILTLLNKFDAQFTESISNIINNMGNDSAKLDKLIALLQKLDEHNTEQNKKILAAIEKLGVDMVEHFNTVIDLQKEGITNQKTTNELIKTTNELIDNMIDLVTNLNIGGGTGGGTIDFSAVIKAIKESAASINSSLVNLANLTKTLNESIKAFAAQNHIDLTKLQESIVNIYNSIVNIEEKENTIIVHCCCGNGDDNSAHEGELSDLNDLLGAKGVQFVFDEPTGISNPTASRFAERGKYMLKANQTIEVRPGVFETVPADGLYTVKNGKLIPVHLDGRK